MKDTLKSLSSYYGLGSTDSYNFGASKYMNTNRTLPNGGGSYSVEQQGVGQSPIAQNTGAPMFTPVGGVGTRNGNYTFQGGTNWLDTSKQGVPQSSGQTSMQTQGQPSQEVDFYAKYRDPKTGEVMSPEDYALFLGGRVPQTSGGSIPQYAGDAMTNPNESAASLRERANNMNNSRNDIATGTTDPYKVGNKSGIAYSPQELAAIEKAYSGIYDPVLNDVFARLKTKEDEQKRKDDREDKIFATNESIRAWRATTGTKARGGDGETSEMFSQTQLNKGASNSGMSVSDFSELDSDIANYWINPPTYFDENSGGSRKIADLMRDVMREVKDGTTSNEDAASEIMAGELPESVKVYLVNQLPADQEKKEGWVKSILNWIW